MKTALTYLQTARTNLRTPLFSCYDILLFVFVVPLSASVGSAMAYLLP
jgi:hypothetical protein